MLKIVITNKLDNVITNIVETAKIVDNGLLVVDNSGEYVIACYSEEFYNKYDSVEIPDGVSIQKYIYDGVSFLKNVNYVGTSDEQIADLQSVIADLTSKLNEKGLIP